jgi:vacuolar-type H+-ATPase subunit E/Vma4
MTVSPMTAMGESLRPVEEALLERGRQEAAQLVDAGEADARRTVAEARAEADRVLAQACAEGEAAAGRAALADLLVARSEARGLILGARRRGFDSLRSGAIHVLEESRETPQVRSLTDRMTTLARGLVGERAVVRCSGPGGLDVIAEANGRRVVVRLEALVDHELGAMGDDVEGLWA